MEVLVALLVLAIGLLGAAGMFTRAIASTIDTERRQMAVMLTGELMETLRGQATHIVDSDGTLKAELGGYAKAKGASLKGVDTCLPTSTEADKRLICWSHRVRQLMPETGPGLDFIHAHFSIVQETADIVAITVAWPVKAGQCLAADDIDGQATYCSYTLRSKL